MYRNVSQLRSAHEFTSTGLFSTNEVFAFARGSDHAYPIIVVINVMEGEVSVSLADLILEMGDSFSGQVLIRSSGDISLFCFWLMIIRMLSGPAEEGNALGAKVDLNNLTLAGNQALILI